MAQPQDTSSLKFSPSAQQYLNTKYPKQEQGFLGVSGVKCMLLGKNYLYVKDFYAH